VVVTSNSDTRLQVETGWNEGVGIIRVGVDDYALIPGEDGALFDTAADAAIRQAEADGWVHMSQFGATDSDSGEPIEVHMFRRASAVA
jgi:hypothetical protein